MGIIELKNKVHQQIENSDEKVLKQISQILDGISDTKLEEILLIKKQLARSKKEYLEGDFETHSIILEKSKAKYFNKG